jgi:hypothetical protein
MAIRGPREIRNSQMRMQMHMKVTSMSKRAELWNWEMSILDDLCYLLNLGKTGAYCWFLKLLADEIRKGERARDRVTAAGTRGREEGGEETKEEQEDITRAGKRKGGKKSSKADESDDDVPLGLSLSLSLFSLFLSPSSSLSLFSRSLSLSPTLSLFSLSLSHYLSPSAPLETLSSMSTGALCEREKFRN